MTGSGPGLAETADALLAQRHVNVRGRQAARASVHNPGFFAAGDKDAGRMVDGTGDPAMPSAQLARQARPGE